MAEGKELAGVATASGHAGVGARVSGRIRELQADIKASRTLPPSALCRACLAGWTDRPSWAALLINRSADTWDVRLHSSHWIVRSDSSQTRWRPAQPCLHNGRCSHCVRPVSQLMVVVCGAGSGRGLQARSGRAARGTAWKYCRSHPNARCCR